MPSPGQGVESARRNGEDRGGEAARAYPPILILAQAPVLFSLTAGATGVMTILHASLQRIPYHLGTPVGTKAFPDATA